jgi:AcrR family transcriptional regulator
MATPKTGWPGPRAAARDRTRDAILEAALQLFAERGYIGTRVEDIAQQAGISRATFYKHFAERDQILEHLFGRLLGNADETVSPPDADPGPRVRALLDAAAATMMEDDLLARFVYSIPIRHDAVLPGGAAVPTVFAHVRDTLEAATVDGKLRDDISLDRAMDMLGRAFESAMREWAHHSVDDPRPRLHELLDIIFGGLLPRG